MNGRMKEFLLPLLCFAASLLVCACSGCDSNVLRTVNVLQGRDRLPPRLECLESVGSREVRIVFDEPVTLVRKNFQYGAMNDRNMISVILDKVLSPGEKVRLSGAVMDENGNRMSFDGEVYGFNNHIPEVLISEITTGGTEKSPDRTEIAVLSDGNMAGMCLCDGIRTDFLNWFVFPDCPVKKGDYVVVCWGQSWKPGYDGVKVMECNGKGNPSQFNGIQTLYRSPSANSELVDCVVYANHDGSAYAKFGSQAVQNRVSTAVQLGFWNIQQGAEEITGLCGVNSARTTATRSISRYFPYVDTDSMKDWYVTQTSGSTFGRDNTSDPY